MELSEELSEIRALPGKPEGREGTLTSCRCPVKTHIMEPRAAQLRRREGLGGEQEDRPSREGEPHFGNAECPGGAGGGVHCREGVPAVYLQSFLLSWEASEGRSQPLPPNYPAGEGRRKELFSTLPYLSDSFTPDGY